MSAAVTLDESIDALTERALDLLERLVAEPSTLGREQSAQEVLAGELAAAGFAIERLALPDDIGSDPLAGVPGAPSGGRYDLVGTRGTRGSGGRSLVVNGHMDVVPADELDAWSGPPFGPVRVSGWLRGRGAGDMKSGFAAGLLAVWALDQVDPGWLGGGRVTWVSAIEEENSGNGTLASARAGHLGEAALLLEPTGLDVLLAGVGIVWVEIEIPGRPAHAEAAGTAVNPILALPLVLDALSSLESGMNEEHAVRADPAVATVPHPYNVSVGRLVAGDWPSSVPSVARLTVRVGHPRAWTSDQALDRIRGAVLYATAYDPWLSEHPPRFRMTGFRAEGYAQDPDTPLVAALSAAHRTVHGQPPATVGIGSTTDARFYVNRFGVPAAAYGPRVRNIHGADEAVEIASIADCARVVARVLHDWFRL